MGSETKIEWCDRTFNPFIGCTKVSPGCTNCYAERFSKRFGIAWGPGQPRKRTSAENWRAPLRWNREAQLVPLDAPTRASDVTLQRRPRVFCASLADVFDTEVPEDWRNDLWELVLSTPHLDWLLLTKRIGNARRMLPWADAAECPTPPNVWLGATVVNQEESDRDIPKLLTTPAAVRFLSIEPILGEIRLDRISRRAELDDWTYIDDALTGWRANKCGGDYIGSKIDWVIVGGESGPRARPTSIEWIRSIVRQCQHSGVPVFVKQTGSVVSHVNRSDAIQFAALGSWRADESGSPLGTARPADAKGGDPSEWPEDLRVRELPR